MKGRELGPYGNSVVSFSIGGNTYFQQLVLSGNKSEYEISVNHSFRDYGEIRIGVSVDVHEDIPETNEGNNENFFSVLIGLPEFEVAAYIEGNLLNITLRNLYNTNQSISLIIEDNGEEFYNSTIFVGANNESFLSLKLDNSSLHKIVLRLDNGFISKTYEVQEIDGHEDRGEKPILYLLVISLAFLIIGLFVVLRGEEKI